MGLTNLSLCLSPSVLSHVEGASAATFDPDHRRPLFKTSQPIYSAHCAMMTFAPHPFQLRFILQTITINSLHI